MLGDNVNFSAGQSCDKRSVDLCGRLCDFFSDD